MLLLIICLFAAATQAVSVFQQVVPPSQFDGVFRPALHWNQDLSDLSHLIPKASDKLYYSDNGGLESSFRKHKFGDITADFWNPTVFLEYSKHFSEVTCTPDTMTISIDTDKAFNIVKKEWGGMDHFMVSTFQRQCMRFPNQHTFWNVTSASFSKSPRGGFVELTGTHHDLEHSLKNWNLKFGHYDPPKVPRSPSSLGRRWSFNESISKSTSSVFPPGDSSPWGPAYLLYEDSEGGADFEIFCVGCEVSENFHIFGEIDYSFPFSITKAQAGLSGPMNVGFGIGVVATYAYSNSWEKELGSLPLAGWDFHIAKLDIQLSLSVKGQFDFSAEGNMKASTSIDWSSVYALVDLKDSSNSQFTGWTPTTSGDLTLGSDINADVTGSLPVELSLTASAFGWSANAGIVDAPGLEIHAEYESTGGDYCNGAQGISWDIDFVNSIYGDVLGDEIPIADQTVPLKTGCIS